MTKSKTKTKLLLTGIVALLLLFPDGCTCAGTIPAPLREPAQKAVEKAVKTPGIDLYMNILGLSQGGLDVTIEARISNNNPVTLDIGNFQIVAKGETGHTYIRDTFTGGSITPNSSRTFTHNIVISLDVLSEKKMITIVDTRAGVAGVTLPVNATVTVSIPDIKNLISAPEINLYIDIRDLSSTGLNVAIEAHINNPNPITLNIGNLQVVAKGETGYTYVQDTIAGHSMGANSSETFTSNIVIPLDVLNERKMITTVDTTAGVTGVSLPITATVTVNMPDIQKLITAPQVTIYADLEIVATFPLPSFKILIDTTVTNSNNFGLIIGDLQINMYRSDGTLVKQTTILGGNIQALTTRTFSSSVPFGSEILRLIGSDDLTIKLNSQAGISGINKKIPLEVNIILSLPHLP